MALSQLKIVGTKPTGAESHEQQVDLAAELGGQSVVSAILNGEREINAKQARALAERFGVSVAAFT